jgi:hypothetical protein
VRPVLPASLSSNSTCRSSRSINSQDRHGQSRLRALRSVFYRPAISARQLRLQSQGAAQAI